MSAPAAPPPPVTRRRASRRSSRRETLAAFGFISPWIIGFVGFTAGPMVWSLVLSFTRYNLVSSPKAAGFDNYRKIFEDPRAHIALLNTFIYAVMYVPAAIILSLFLATLLTRVTHGASFFRTVFYLPVMTPAVAVAVMFSLLLNGSYGLVDHALSLVHIPGPQWLTDPSWVKPGVALMSLWGLGGAVVIFFAALQNVPTDLYEAAAIDGASRLRQFRHVTMPMISSVIFFQVVVLTIASLQMFDKVFVLFGNPGSQAYASDASLFYVLYLFQEAFQALNMGYASALAWILFIIIMIITLIQVKIGNRIVYYEGERR